MWVLIMIYFKFIDDIRTYLLRHFIFMNHLSTKYNSCLNVHSYITTDIVYHSFNGYYCWMFSLKGEIGPRLACAFCSTIVSCVSKRSS